MDVETGRSARRLAARIRTFIATLPGGSREAVLSAADVAEAARAMLRAVDAPAAVVEKRLTERTIRYFQSVSIVTPPEGATTAARYGVRQVLEAVAARLAGHVRRKSLSEVADELSRRSSDRLLRYIAELASESARETERPAGGEPRPLPGVLDRQTTASAIAAFDGVVADRHLRVVPIGYGSFIVVSAAHPAFGRVSDDDARERVRAALLP
jgi:hypothetical protein